MNNNNKIYIHDNKTTSTTPTPPLAATNNNNIITRSNGTQACAACKYQRRKCAPDCILAPYFPHHRQLQFLNAHKLFGVSNVTKIIRYLDQHDKDEAMRTIIYQSDVRANDPVGGCYRIIRELQRQIEYDRAELQLVLHQLAYCRAQKQQQNVVNLLPSNNNTCLFDMLTNNHEGWLDDDQDQQQYIVHGDDFDQEVHFEEINSWEATIVDDGAEDGKVDIKVKILSDDQTEEFKYEVEDKIFDSVNNFRLKTSTPAI